MAKPELTWDYPTFLARMERHRQEVDGAHELAMHRLRALGGSLWKDKLCQADIIRTIVQSVRDNDARRKKL